MHTHMPPVHMYAFMLCKLIQTQGNVNFLQYLRE